ncbi:type II toxin-antitoxin system RelE/ParE family toxin [Phascolarctobacterium sp.]
MTSHKQFKILYSETFYKDLYAIAYYIQEILRNRAASRRLTTLIFNSINARADNAESFEPLFDDSGNKYFRIYVKNYVIYYRVENNTMEIARIIFKNRDISELL